MTTGKAPLYSPRTNPTLFSPRITYLQATPTCFPWISWYAYGAVSVRTPVDVVTSSRPESSSASDSWPRYFITTVRGSVAGASTNSRLSIPWSPLKRRSTPGRISSYATPPYIGTAVNQPDGSLPMKKLAFPASGSMPFTSAPGLLPASPIPTIDEVPDSWSILARRTSSAVKNMACPAASAWKRTEGSFWPTFSMMLNGSVVTETALSSAVTAGIPARITTHTSKRKRSLFRMTVFMKYNPLIR